MSDADVEACERAFSSYNPGGESDASSEAYTPLYRQSSTETDPEARARGLELTQSEEEWEREPARFQSLSCDDEMGEEESNVEPAPPAAEEPARVDGMLKEGERSDECSDLGLTRPASSAGLRPAQWCAGLPPPPQTDMEEPDVSSSESEWDDVPIAPSCAEEVSSK